MRMSAGRRKRKGRRGSEVWHDGWRDKADGSEEQNLEMGAVF